MTVKTLKDLIAEGVEGRHVLVRSDFNVPLNDAREITDAGRITHRCLLLRLWWMVAPA